jgi:hypothetical protein
MVHQAALTRAGGLAQYRLLIFHPEGAGRTVRQAVAGLICPIVRFIKGGLGLGLKAGIYEKAISATGCPQGGAAVQRYRYHCDFGGEALRRRPFAAR